MGKDRKTSVAKPTHSALIKKQSKQLETIAWIISHELRPPVCAIQGLIALFNVENCADPINTEILKNVKEAVDRLDAITKMMNAQTIIK